MRTWWTSVWTRRALAARLTRARCSRTTTQRYAATGYIRLALVDTSLNVDACGNETAERGAPTGPDYFFFA